jgi:hypothetical protein
MPQYGQMAQARIQSWDVGMTASEREISDTVYDNFLLSILRNAKPMRSKASCFPGFGILFIDIARFLGWGSARSLLTWDKTNTEETKTCIDTPSGI